jgi:hypothetical protein
MFTGAVGCDLGAAHRGLPESPHDKHRPSLLARLSVWSNELPLIRCQATGEIDPVTTRKLTPLIIDLDRQREPARRRAPSVTPDGTVNYCLSKKTNTTSSSHTRDRRGWPLSGTTKKGTQCSRNAQPGRSYCWQH